MTIQVAGDNWDAAVYAALDERPPPPGAPFEAARLHVLVVMLDAIEDSLRRYLAATQERLAPALGDGADPAAAVAGWLAEYFLRMHRAFDADPAAACAASLRPAIDDARAAAAGDGGGVILTFQAGMPLLLPHVWERATERPVHAIVHDRNEHAFGFVARSLDRGGPLPLAGVDGAALASALDGGGGIVANVDVAYPGTRSTALLDVFGGRLEVPAGLLRFAVARDAPVRAALLLDDGGVLRTRCSGPLPADEPAALAALAAFVEREIAAAPEQWTGWGGVVAAAGPAD